MKVNRKAIRIEPLELLDDNGNVIEEIHFRSDFIKVAAVMQDFGSSVATTDDEINDKVGTLCETLYGEDGKRMLFDYFDGDYASIMDVVANHMNNVIIPALKEKSKRMTEKMKKYKA